MTAEKEKKLNGKQAKKSAATRSAILKTAVNCFVDLGYANTSTQIIAKRAKVSRGAMLHHFPTKQELLHAAVNYILDQRIKSFEREIRTLKTIEERAKHGMDTYWKHLNGRLFTAQCELSQAARTDPQLNAVMKVSMKNFEEKWRKSETEIFPEWSALGPLHELAVDIAQFMMEGMANARLSHDVKERQERILNYLKARMKDIYAAGVRGDNDSAVLSYLDKNKSTNKT